MKTVVHFLLALLLLIPFTSCEDDDDVMDQSIAVPETYSFSREGVSTVSFTGQSERIAMAGELLTAMSDPSKSLDDLNNMFRNPEGVDPFSSPALNASTKSLRSKVAASADLFATNSGAAAGIRTTFDDYLANQVNKVFPAWSQLAERGRPGQLADGSSTRYVSEDGYEYNQLFAKALIGALMYDQLVNNYLSPTVLDAGTNRADNTAGTPLEGKPYTDMEHKWDEAFGYLFGASASPEKPLTDLGEVDGFLNEYLERVDGDTDYTGTAEATEKAFRAGRAAIVAGDYEERDAQADVIKDNLTKVLAVRAIFYLMQGKAGLEATPVDHGAAFHDLSEGYGFIYSLRFTPSTVGYTEAARLSDSYLSSLTVLSELDNSTNRGFWDVAPAELETIATAIADQYGLVLAEAAN
ncbi:DUF4856 domain-containing protein [Neolewinella antarctica]|uniref:DUF4856 domain-containing protein n=1 Tax=Neolewinella antarctica TaxID=442734 RepID=A0ABX0X7S9_9BACT|nr:DUF4856 domain-containing protein [Neolewinella antarctica]NJC25039.1 hypothetical protein [Neolewinella antarctica]